MLTRNVVACRCGDFRNDGMASSNCREEEAETCAGGTSV